MVMKNEQSDYSAFNTQKEDRLKQVAGHMPQFELVHKIVVDQLISIDATLDSYATSIDLLGKVLVTYSRGVDYDKLIRLIYTVRRDPEFVNRSMQSGETEAVYGIKLRNLEPVKANVEQLKKFEATLRKMKLGGIEEKLPNAFELLKTVILPGDFTGKSVIDFLLDDTTELKEVYEQVYEELALFKALCALIESFPRKLVVQMLDDAENTTPTQ